MNDISLLYIEDDVQARKHYSSGFTHLFQDVYVAADAATGFKLYEQYHPDILLVDIELPDESGLSLIEKIRKNNQKCIIIVLSAFSQREQLLKAVELGLYKYLIKPTRNSELLQILNESIHQIKAQKQIDNTVELCHQLIWHKSLQLLYENDFEIRLSIHENRLIELLQSNRSQIFSLWDIAEYVWEGEPEPSVQAIKNLLNRLRKKVSVDFICNHYRVGYQLCS